MRSHSTHGQDSRTSLAAPTASGKRTPSNAIPKTCVLGASHDGRKANSGAEGHPPIDQDRARAQRHVRALGDGHLDRVGVVVGEPLPSVVVVPSDPVGGGYPRGLRNGDVVDGEQTCNAVG